MKKQKESKKKPYRSVLSNAIWSFGEQLKSAPGVLVMQIVQMFVNIGRSYANIYLPALVVAEVTGHQTFTHAAIAIGMVMFAILVCDMLRRVLLDMIGSMQPFHREYEENELNKKAGDIFYQLSERKDIRDLFEKGRQALWMWNRKQPIQDMPAFAWKLLESVLCYVLFGSVLSFVSPWLVVLLTIAPVLNWFCVRAYQNWQYRKEDKWSEIGSRLNYVNSSPADYELAKDIRIYSLAGWFREMYHDLEKEYSVMETEKTWRSFLSKSVDLLVILLRDGIAYALLISMMLKKEIAVDEFVFYFASVSSFADWVGAIMNGWLDLRETSLKICDFREYMDYEESDGTGEADVTEYLDTAPEITFSHVTLRYEEAEKDTLHDVSFTIRPGEKIALVGLNGAGKTTLVKLLCGLYLPTEGDILINGMSITKFYRKDYYKLVSAVFQMSKTMFLSLAEMVSCVAENETDMSRAEQCMRMAGLGEKIDALPLGIRTKLDKQVNENGTELSGGELQKLMLARALYKDSPLLVLDEPTSALDPIAEHEIYQKYNEMTQNKTSLFVSHRLSSTRFCDRIFYLKDGKITEEGSHAELLAAGGEYARLYEMQSCWYREGKEVTGDETI